MLPIFSREAPVPHKEIANEFPWSRCFRSISWITPGVWSALIHSIDACWRMRFPFGCVQVGIVRRMSAVRIILLGKDVNRCDRGTGERQPWCESIIKGYPEHLSQLLLVMAIACGIESAAWTQGTNTPMIFTERLPDPRCIYSCCIWNIQSETCQWRHGAERFHVMRGTRTYIYWRFRYLSNMGRNHCDLWRFPCACRTVISLCL